MIRCTTLILLPVLAFASCGGTDAVEGLPTQPPAAAAKALLLATDPGEGIGVVDTKIEGAADAVVVSGRIRDIVKGYAAFTLIDLDMAFCGEQCDEGCPTPWDYCCDDNKTIAANSLAVEARGADGKPISTPALPDLRLLDAVKVTGKVIVDEHGNNVLLATGIYRTERPELPTGLIWPQ